MLSVFDSDNMDGHFDDAFYESLPTANNERFRELVVPRDLVRTVFALARHDPVFRDRLRNAVNKDICAQDFINKLSIKRQKYLRRFDDYVHRGPRFDPAFVNKCGTSLYQLLQDLSIYRSERAPLAQSFETRAAELALHMLEDTFSRNKDIYENSTWQTTADDPDEERDCNLFANLISDPPSDREHFFVLDLLTKLPLAAWQHMFNHLERLLGKLKEEEAAASFTRKLEDLIIQAKTEEQLFEEPEEQSHPSSVDQWSHIQASLSSGPVAGPSRERRPTLEDRPDAQRRRLE